MVTTSCPQLSPCNFSPKSSPKHSIVGAIESHNSDLSNDTICKPIRGELHVQEPPLSLGGHISFPLSPHHGISINPLMCGLHRTAFFVAFQRRYFQDIWIKTGGSGLLQALGLSGIHLPFLLSFYDGDYMLWGATGLDRRPLFRAFFLNFFQGDWMGVRTLRLVRVFCSSSTVLLSCSQ